MKPNKKIIPKIRAGMSVATIHAIIPTIDKPNKMTSDEG
jgi:hypothetical protein